MYSEFYIGTYSSEAAIRSLNDDLMFPGSEIKQLKVKEVFNGSVPEPVWRWRTPYQRCLTLFPEEELEIFLKKNMNLMTKLKAHRESNYDFAAVIVCRADDGERPPGYSISLSLMEMLTSINASLEIDVVQLVRRN